MKKHTPEEIAAWHQGGTTDSAKTTTAGSVRGSQTDSGQEIPAKGTHNPRTHETAPDGLEVVAWGIVASNTGRMCQVELNADEVEGHKQQYIRPLVTLASAQAAVAAERERGDEYRTKYNDTYGALDDCARSHHTLEQRITVLESALGVARETCIDVKMGLERARIWSGMDWAYQPIHPVLYRPLIDKATAAKELIDTTLGAKT